MIEYYLTDKSTIIACDKPMIYRYINGRLEFYHNNLGIWYGSTHKTMKDLYSDRYDNKISYRVITKEEAEAYLMVEELSK